MSSLQTDSMVIDPVSLQPDHASVYFEVYFDRMASSTLRAAIATECTTCINNLVPAATRGTWLNKPYIGGNDPANQLTFVTKLFQDADPTLSPQPTPPNTFYCWQGNSRTCYSSYAVNQNGVPVTVTVSAGGEQVTCEIWAVMMTLP